MPTAARPRRDDPQAAHGATALLDEVELPADTSEALVHVRDYTKGHPTLLANNHPIRHGSVVGIHNGVIANDEEIFDRPRDRARRGRE